MPASTQELLEVLDLTEIGPDRFVGIQPRTVQQRVFGGQVVGQSLAAADRTAPNGMISNSLHAYFLRGGDPSVAIEYEVDRIREGRSFATRRVVAYQHNKPIYTTLVSFHIDEPGFEHQDPMPPAPGPDDSTDYAGVFRAAAGSDVAGDWLADWPMLDLRHAGSTRLGDLDAHGKPALAQLWMRVRDPLPDDPMIHRELLGYLSDLTLLGAATIPHQGHRMPFAETASLDHAVWFHRPARVDEWVLFAQHSPTASGARGLIRGEFYTTDGVLIASVMQEGLIRPNADEMVR